MPVSQDHLENKLRENLEPIFMKVEDFSDGCGAKYNLFLVSKKFEGQSLLNRQRLVNTILTEELKSIHALTQKCVTPEQWEKMIADNPEIAQTGTQEQGTSSKKCEFHSH